MGLEVAILPSLATREPGVTGFDPLLVLAADVSALSRCGLITSQGTALPARTLHDRTYRQLTRRTR